MTALEKRIAAAGEWAVAADDLQWILLRHQGGRWRAISFVRTTKDILARCCREHGAPPDVISALLTDLPDRFQEGPPSHLNRGSVQFAGTVGSRP